MHTGVAAANVVGSYIDFIGRLEESRRLPIVQGGLRRAAQHIGEGCRLLITREDENAKRALQIARLLLDPLTLPVVRRPKRNLARLLFLTTAAIDQRDHPGELDNIRLRIQQETAAQLVARIENFEALSSTTQSRLRGKRADALGDITEKTALGALTHPGYKDSLGLTALPQHENGTPIGKRNHFDLTYSVADGTLACTQKVQIKLECLGYCADSRSSDRRNLKALQAQYDEDIAFGSGCCDLGIRKDAEHQYDLSIPNLIVREANGDISSREQGRLDDVSGRFYQAILNGQNRTGHLPASGLA